MPENGRRFLSALNQVAFNVENDRRSYEKEAIRKPSRWIHRKLEVK